MKKLIFILILLLFPVFSFASDYEKWAMVRDGKIVKFKTIKADDTIMKPKLIAHNYVIAEETSIPNYDPIKEIVTFKYEINSNKVVKAYTIEKRSDAEIKEIKTKRAVQQAVSSFAELLNASITINDIQPILDQYKNALNEIEEVTR